MGIVISKEFGGLGFSAHAHAKIVEKIAGRNGAAAVTVMVPNSLGPGELLFHYGTEEQKAYYLPRLAHGIDIPCFGLTGPPNGSDAASMRDEGIVCKENGVLGMRVTFNKRYITLGPVATVIGLAFKLRDPEKLLTKGKEGITVALLPKDKNQFAPNGLPGLVTGNRHDPLGVAFMNGTIQGQSVFVPMSCVIGGEERTGFGWNMLMECLGEGRGISLPAMGIASSKIATLAVGGYARVRKQFKVPIAAMEGVQEKLAVIAGNTFTTVAAQHLFDAILADKQKPPVLSAIMKLHCTERGREVPARHAPFDPRSCFRSFDTAALTRGSLTPGGGLAVCERGDGHCGRGGHQQGPGQLHVDGLPRHPHRHHGRGRQRPHPLPHQLRPGLRSLG